MLRRASPATGLLVALACPAGGARAFRLVYAAFRVIDDAVDAPGPVCAAALVEAVEATLAGAPAATPALPLDQARAVQALAAVRADPLGDRLDPALRGMWAAQRFDLDRRGGPPSPAAALEAQRARIGDSYLLALWVCSGAPDAPPAALLPLARAATGAHWLRDAEEDRALGYCNVPAERLGRTEPGAWLSQRQDALRAELAAGLAALARSRCPLRTRLLLRLLAARYGRLLDARDTPGSRGALPCRDSSP